MLDRQLNNNYHWKSIMPRVSDDSLIGIIFVIYIYIYNIQGVTERL